MLVRQGDPLSPYLFILMQELLTKLINKEKELGSIKVFRYRRLKINHLFFADDIIMVMKCCERSCRSLKRVLNYCGQITNQKINFKKFEIFFPCVYQSRKKLMISSILEVKEERLPLKYLGAYIDKGMISVNIQRQIIEKAENKLENWTSKEVSQAGEVILVNSVINSRPIHILSTMWINKKVVSDHKKSVRGFLWKSGKKKYGFHLVNWKKVTLSKADEGLEVKDLNIFKIAIHVKRILQILNNKDQIWSKLINVRYTGLHPWRADKRGRVCWTTKAIINAMEILRDGLKIKIGDGRNANIWQDPWIESLPLVKWLYGKGSGCDYGGRIH
ncbi:hypothetical protein Cni_G29103 [Canna indica]|uniref:Reverse transcriptase domain-containing protein n=1 Tax=Canna indica TaxID=4628 RepID=A0AAQ3L492_9LILI|nr:hypothetical protein Cni_G29103 [Canna indica]